MLGTLIKHEARRTVPRLATGYGISAAAVVTSALLVRLSIPVLSDLGNVIVVALLSGTAFVMQLHLGLDFWSTGFGQRGYLTHSLPVKGSLILWARLLWAALVSAFATLWITLMGAFYFVLMPGGDGWERLVTLIETVGRSSTPWQLVLLALLGWFFLWETQVILYFASSLGSTPPLARLGTGGPVLVWFLVWVVAQILGFASLLIPVAYIDLGAGLGVHVVDVFAMIEKDSDQLFIPVGWIPLALGLAVIAVMWMRRIWNHQISLR